MHEEQCPDIIKFLFPFICSGEDGEEGEGADGRRRTEYLVNVLIIFLTGFFVIKRNPWLRVDNGWAKDKNSGPFFFFRPAGYVNYHPIHLPINFSLCVSG